MTPEIFLDYLSITFDNVGNGGLFVFVVLALLLALGLGWRGADAIRFIKNSLNKPSDNDKNG